MLDNYHKYLNLSDQEKDWGFYITTVGYSRTPKNMHYPDLQQHPDDHGFSWNKGRILNAYYIVFITSGSGIFDSAETPNQAIEAGTCFILSPGMWHRYKPNDNIGWEEYWVGFNGSYPTQIMSKFFDPEKPVIKTGLNKDLLSLFSHLLGVVSQAQIGYPQQIIGINLQILGLLNVIKDKQAIDNNSEAVWISKVIFHLQHQLSDPVNIEELAKHFPYSYSKFRKAFKKHTGTSPSQYHLNLRLNKASELLKNTNLSVKEVSYHTGFDSPHYFSRIFKAKFKFPPQTYRKEL